MSEQRQLWTPHTWLKQTAMREVSDQVAEPPVDIERMPTSRHVAVGPAAADPSLQDTIPLDILQDAQLSPPAYRVAEEDGEPAPVSPQPASIPAKDILEPKRQRQTVRWISTALAVLLLLLTNVALQLNRRTFDVLSESFPDGALARVQRCESLGRTPDVLYMGSSLTMHAVSPTLVDETVRSYSGQQILSCNVAEDGSTFEQDYYTLKRVIEDGFAPKLIVETLWEYNVDLRKQPYADTNPLPAAHMLSLADVSDVYALSPHFGSGAKGKLAAVNFVAGKTIPFYGDRIALFKSICGQSTIGPCVTKVSSSVVASPLQKMVLPSDSRGWVGLVGRSLATYPAEMLRPYTSCGNRCPPFVIGGHQSAFLSKFIALAHTHHIQIVLVIPPFSRYFFNVLRSADWQMLVSFLQSFATPPGVTFYDESHDPAYHDTDFWDIHHLDTDGAVKFSTWLGQTLIPHELLTV